MIWPYVAGFAVALIAVYALSPKPQSQPPAGFEDLKVPTADEGREIPVLFGTRDLRAPNTVWYGDFDSKAIRKSGGKK